jgi:hypothetical protein
MFFENVSKRTQILGYWVGTLSSFARKRGIVFFNKCESSPGEIRTLVEGSRGPYA